MELSKIKSGVSKLAYELIRKDVILGKLVAGSKLKLSALQQQYSVSMPTLRNILQSLTGEGFVVAEDQRGFFVSPLSRKNLNELVELRYLLESHMIEVSYDRGNLEWESRVLAAYHRLQGLEKKYLNGGSGSEEFFDLKMADYEFHCSLISGCDSTELLSIHKTTFDKYLRYLLYCIGFRGSIATQEHKILADSALSRDKQIARETLKKHIYECAMNVDKIHQLDHLLQPVSNHADFTPGL